MDERLNEIMLTLRATLKQELARIDENTTASVTFYVKNGAVAGNIEILRHVPACTAKVRRAS